MAEAFTSYSVDNDKRFARALDEASKSVGDLTIPLTLISKDFYKSQRPIFSLKGPGQYPPISIPYAEQKQREVGFVYPLLVKSGLLKNSLTNPAHPMAINQILNKVALVLGTQVEYLVYHQSDRPRSKMPLRKALFIGPEAPRFATSEQAGRVNRWTNILGDFVKQKLTVLGEVR